MLMMILATLICLHTMPFLLDSDKPKIMAIVYLKDMQEVCCNYYNRVLKFLLYVVNHAVQLYNVILHSIT